MSMECCSIVSSVWSSRSKYFIQVFVTVVLVRIVCVIAFSQYNVDAFQVVDGLCFFLHVTLGRSLSWTRCLIAKRTKRLLDVACASDDRARLRERAAHEPQRSAGALLRNTAPKTDGASA